MRLKRGHEVQPFTICRDGVQALAEIDQQLCVGHVPITAQLGCINARHSDMRHAGHAFGAQLHGVIEKRHDHLIAAERALVNHCLAERLTFIILAMGEKQGTMRGKAGRDPRHQLAVISMG